MKTTRQILKSLKKENISVQCFYCKTQLDYNNITQDHVVPRAKGGEDCDENIVLSCQFCNSLKRDYLPEQLDYSKLGQYRIYRMMFLAIKNRLIKSSKQLVLV